MKSPDADIVNERKTINKPFSDIDTCHRMPTKKPDYMNITVCFVPHDKFLARKEMRLSVT